MAGIKQQLFTVLVSLTLVGLVGAEYYRFSLNQQADDKDRAAKLVVKQATDLKTREQRLQPDLPLMERLETTMLDPKKANLHQQLLSQMLTNQNQAGLKLKTAQIGQRSNMGGAERHEVSVQMGGSLTGLVEYLRYVETGSAAARVTGLRLSLDPNTQQATAPQKPGATQAPPSPFQLTTEYYSRKQ